jgi:MoxR-like ATPase
MKLENLKLLIAAGNPIISISTPDEPRAVWIVHEVARAVGLPVSAWSLTEGLQPCGVEQVLVEAGKPAAALKYVKDSSQPAIYLFKDLGQHAKDPQILRYLRDLYFSPVSRPWTLILLDAGTPPIEMRRLSLPFEIGWPDEEEILSIIRKTYQEVQQRSLHKVESRLSKKELELAVQTLRGLTSEEIVRVVSEALYDEIEKAFASASSESADGGLSQRVFGTLLTWMQDHRQPIFLIATANEIERLPPELVRKGRFDEIFFVDLPGADEREVIFSIHLRKRGRDKAAFDMARLTAAAENFTGAEIEQAVVSGLYAAYAEKGECTTEHILSAITVTRPIAVIMRERVDNLRAWAKGRCVMAD